jgi:hypothetical protein
MGIIRDTLLLVSSVATRVVPEFCLIPWQLEFCSNLAGKLPCEQAAGPWEHICRASAAVSCESHTPKIFFARTLSWSVPERMCVKLGSS